MLYSLFNKAPCETNVTALLILITIFISAHCEAVQPKMSSFGFSLTAM